MRLSPRVRLRNENCGDPFAIRSAGHDWEIVHKVSLNDFSRQKIDASVNELKEEKALVAELLG